MTLEQSIKFYESQAAALNVVERMEQAMSRVVEQMEKLLNSTQKTTSQASKMTSPFDSLMKTIGGKVEGNGLKGIKDYFNPKKLLGPNNFFLPLAISVGWQLFGDDIMTLLSPAMEVLQSFAGLVHNTLAALAPLFQPVVFGLGMISAGLGAMAQNAALFLPAVMGIALLVGWVQKAVWFTKLAAIASAAYQMTMGFLTMAVGALSGNMTLATAGIVKMNSAMIANPAAAIVTGILLLVGVLIAAVNLFNRLNGTAVSVAGVIGAAFAVLGAFVMNTALIPLWNMFAALANFLGNLFRDPVAAIQVLFYDMALGVLNNISGMAGALENLINRIPGMQVDLTSGLNGYYDQLSKAAQTVKDNSGWVEYVKTRENVDYGQAAAAGYSVGEKLWSKAGSLFGAGTENGLNVDTVNTVKDVNGSVNIADEDMRFIKDSAEMRFIQNFVTLTPTVAMNANISGITDVDAMLTAMGKRLEEMMVVSAEGVHP